MRKLRLSQRLLLLVFGILLARPAYAERVDLGAGVSIEAPDGAQRVEGLAPPVARAWKFADTGITIQAILLPGAGEGAQALNNWPDVGRALIQNFGKSTSESLSQALNASCTFAGEPVARDLDRSLMRVRVTARCAETPGETVVGYELLSVVTNSGQVVVRGAVRGGALNALAPVVDAILRSLQVDASAKPALQAEAAKPPASAEAQPAPAHRYRLVDYTSRSPLFFLGRFFGVLALNLILGYAICSLARRSDAPIAPLLLAGQLMLFALLTFGDSYDGTYEIDVLCRIAPAIIAFVGPALYFRRRKG